MRSLAFKTNPGFSDSRYKMSTLTPIYIFGNRPDTFEKSYIQIASKKLTFGSFLIIYVF